MDWVRHGNRGRTKPWGVSEAIKKRMVELAGNKYLGFNARHLTEKLVEIEKIVVSRETVRRLLGIKLSCRVRSGGEPGNTEPGENANRGWHDGANDGEPGRMA